MFQSLPERFCKIGTSFLNICSHLQANSVKSVSYFFKRTSSSQVTIEIGMNVLGAKKKTFCSPEDVEFRIFIINSL